MSAFNQRYPADPLRTRRAVASDVHRTRFRALACVPLVLAIVTMSVAACSGGSADRHTSGQPSAAASAEPVSLAPCTGDKAHPVSSGGLPELTLDCLGRGPSVDVAKIAGPAVVNLWASWCHPCRAEMPLLQQTSKADRGRVRILGVDTNDQSAAARKFAQNTVHATYEQLSDPTGQLARKLHAPGLPYSVAIDRSGAVVWRKAGKMTGADIAKAVHAARTGG